MLTRPPVKPLLSLALAVATGVLLGSGQAPLGVWPATILGVGLFTWLVAVERGRSAFGLGYVVGLALNTLIVSWVSVLGVWVAVALIAFMSLWWGLLALVVSRLVRLRAWPLLVPAAFVAAEFGSGSIPFGGFPWTRLGYTAIDQPLSGYYAWVGVAGTSYLLALTATCLLWAVVSKGARLRALAVAVLIFTVGGLLNLVPVATPEEQVSVALVQPNVNRAEKGTATYARSVTNNALSETIYAAALARTQDRHVDFALWPENATDIDPVNDPETRRLVELSAALIDAPIFVGAVTDGPEPDTRQTTSLWWDPRTGPGPAYHKRNLVPFGEYIPFRRQLLPVLPILQQVGRDSVPGEGPGVLDVSTRSREHLLIGTMICFELFYDDTAYDLIRSGAEVIVSQSNTNTYIATMEPHQQFALNRIRAMETGREVLAATLNSYSAVIDAKGRVLQKQPEEMEATTLLASVPLRHNVNLSVRVNPWLSWVAVAVTLVGVGLTLPRRPSGDR